MCIIAETLNLTLPQSQLLTARQAANARAHRLPPKLKPLTLSQNRKRVAIRCSALILIRASSAAMGGGMVAVL